MSIMVTSGTTSQRTDDWKIDVTQLVDIGAGARLEADVWVFVSQRLNYVCAAAVLRFGLGATLGVRLPNVSKVAELISNRVGALISQDQTNFRVLRPFSVDDLDEGATSHFSVGATAVAFEGTGGTFWLKNNAGQEIVEYKEGEVGLGLGVQLNIGSMTWGDFDFVYGTPITRDVQQVLNMIEGAGSA